MKILIITTDYFPDLTPNTYRWQAIAEQWVDDGHEVHVLAPFSYSESTFMNTNGVNVHRKGSNTLMDWVYNILKIKNRRNRISDATARASKNRLFITLNKIVSLTWRNLYWPDGSCLWYFPARRKAMQLIQEHQIDLIISVCLPFTATLIAAHCKQKNPDIFWISDIEDPFSFLVEQPKNNHRLYKRLNYRAEQKVIQQADAISLTVASAKSRYVEYFGHSHKMQVIPPLLNENLARERGAFPPLFEEGKIHLVYFGAFYFGIREPNEFLNLLEKTLAVNEKLKATLSVHFFGGIEPEFQAVFKSYDSLKKNIQLHGLVERSEVFQRMQEADFLLNIGNTTDHQLPSKCVDYCSSGKPIIHIQYVQEDPFEEFFKDYPLFCGLRVAKEVNEVEQIATMVKFIQSEQGKKVDQMSIEQQLRPYTTKAIASKYLALVKEK